MRARRDLLALGAVALGSAGLGLFLGPGLLQQQPGRTLLAATFSDLSGRARKLEEWRGNVLACNFWATWCAPCREEMPMLDEIHRAFEAKGAQVVGIGIDQAEKISEFAKSLKISYPLLVGDGNALALMRRLGNEAGGLPFTVLLDRQGSVRERRLGIYRRDELAAAVGRMTSEKR